MKFARAASIFLTATCLTRPAAAQMGPSDQQVTSPEAGSGDIIVTAQRRDEKLRDVPISITAISGAQLAAAGIRDTLSLTTTTPGLYMQRVGAFTIPAIRGITTQVTAAGGDNNVATYVDGVYRPASLGGTFDLPDIERVEILKGPQGTLFGRNATGGAIQIYTKLPSYATTGSITASYGRFNDFQAKGFVSMPIVTDKVAISIAALYENSDGYLKNFVNGDNAAPVSSRLIRGKLLIEPTENLKVLLSAFYSKRTDGSATFSIPLAGNSIGRAIPGTLFPPGGSSPYQVAVSPITSQGKSFNEDYGASANITLNLGAGELKSITAWGNYKSHSYNDADSTFQPVGAIGLFYDSSSTDRALTQEVTFASKLDGPVNIVVGGFYIDGFGRWEPIRVLTDTSKVNIFGRSDYTAAAGFGEIYYNVTDKLQLIGGLRYSWEKRDLNSGLYLLNGTFVQGLSSSGNRPAKATYHSVTPRATIKYAIGSKTNAYATYSQGFKSGIFDAASVSLQADGTLPLVKPEKIRAYEVGLKSRIADILDISIAAFHYNYKDIQVNGYACVPVGSPTCVNLSELTNAAAARINGLDIDGTLHFSKEFSLRNGISILDAKYTNFKGAPIEIPNINNSGSKNSFIDASGRQMLRAPKFTISSTANYTISLIGGELNLLGTVYHTSRILYTFDGRINQKPYTTLDGRISWSPDHSGLTLSVYGNNLTAVKRLQSVFSNQFADAVGYAPPATYGIEAGLRF